MDKVANEFFGNSEEEKESTNFMLSFMAILVDRAGGKIKINNLSEYASRHIELGFVIDKENDCAIIRTIKIDSTMN